VGVSCNRFSLILSASMFDLERYLLCSLLDVVLCKMP